MEKIQQHANRIVAWKSGEFGAVNRLDGLELFLARHGALGVPHEHSSRQFRRRVQPSPASAAVKKKASLKKLLTEIFTNCPVITDGAYGFTAVYCK
jgi:hypothetical protein